MIQKNIPGFSFRDPKNKNVLNLRIESVVVNVGTRPLRAIWTPELLQDLQAYQNIDAEAELTAILGQEIAREIDNQIIQDLNDNGRRYPMNNQTVTDVINRWTHIHRGHRAPIEFNHPPNEGNQWPTLLPIARQVAARTIGLDLVTVQPLAAPLGLINYIGGFDPYRDDPNYIVLPNEEGWYTNGYFESILIKMDMKIHKFIPPKPRPRRRPRPLTPRDYIR